MANSSNLAFCLEYSNHKTDMMEAFDDYLRNESMVDVMLSCEGKTIKAHKMVLSAGSTYFRNIFAAFKNPFQFPVLIIKDMSFRDLKAIVEFLYRGEVVVPVEQVSSLSKSAQTLFIKGLEKYFNKSAVVNVANHSANSSKTVSNNEDNSLRPKPHQNSVNVPKSRAKQTLNDSNRSIGMSLRKTRRPDYRQLSNGDFNSDDDNSDIEYSGHQSNRVSQMSDSKYNPSTNLRNSCKYSGLLSRRIKSEIINENDSSDNPEHNSNVIIENSDNEEDVIDEQIMFESNRFSGTDLIETESIEDPEEELEQQLHKASTSKMDVSIEMPPLMRKPSASPTSRKVKTQTNRRKGIPKATAVNSNQRSSLSKSDLSGMPSLRPIKTDPEKVTLIHCSLCPRVFSQTSSLSIHMKRIHADDNKEHICHLCGKKYSWRSGLYKHMRTHRNT